MIYIFISVINKRVKIVDNNKKDAYVMTEMIRVSVL